MTFLNASQEICVPMHDMIVFPHIPKCAGTSLSEGIASAVGSERIYFDYDNNPGSPTSDHAIDPLGSMRRFHADRALLDDKRIAYGHFHPAKYRKIWPSARWMTVLRHPVDRVISHYYFWKVYDPSATNPVRHYLHRHRLSLIEFASLPYSRSFYRGLFFSGLERSDFAFVGRADDLDAVARIVGDAIGAPIYIPNVNISLLRCEDAARQEIDSALPMLKSILADEIDFYERWVDYKS